jgi:hypothetical protein
LEADKTGTTIKHLFINFQMLQKKEKESIVERKSSNNLLIKIKLLEAEGVPVPESGKIPTEQILLREVGVLIYDKFKGKFLENCVYLKGNWKEN